MQSGNPNYTLAALHGCGALHNAGAENRRNLSALPEAEENGRSALCRPQPRLSGLRGRIFVG